MIYIPGLGKNVDRIEDGSLLNIVLAIYELIKIYGYSSQNKCKDIYFLINDLRNNQTKKIVCLIKYLFCPFIPV